MWWCLTIFVNIWRCWNVGPRHGGRVLGGGNCGRTIQAADQLRTRISSEWVVDDGWCTSLVSLTMSTILYRTHTLDGSAKFGVHFVKTFASGFPFVKKLISGIHFVKKLASVILSWTWCLGYRLWRNVFLVFHFAKHFLWASFCEETCLWVQIVKRFASGVHSI